eukprot:g5821.t1
MQALLTTVLLVFRDLLNATVGSFRYLYNAIVQCREFCMTQILPSLCNLCSWKTYKKVMPWRRALGKLVSETKTVPIAERLHQDDLFGSEEDIDFFQRRTVDGPEWKIICQKSLGDSLNYSAQMRILQDNKTEYKSTTIVRNSTAEELTAFYLDDECRQQWDGLLAKCESIELGPKEHRCEVVRWIRSFPFPFLSDREYVISRRMYRRDEIIYTISKGIRHESVPETSSVVRMDVYYSMWSCRDIQCPWGSDQTACEVILLHHEQFKIPERLARFAAVKGMWGFIKCMRPAMVSFVQDYREQMTRLQLENERPDSESSSIAERMCHGSLGTRTGMSRGKNKAFKTIRRTLFATVVSATVILIKKLNQK